MSINNTNTQETSFWKFLTDNTIEIPIIQRDYAQGRLGKEYLRKSFLTDIKDALDNALKDDGKTEMKLDFVYGSVENEKMNPLDGQQRLTTLWLLHWYIALRAGKLNNEVAGVLNRFSYETRISSREFLGNLCILEHFKVFDGNDIVGFITRQTWFYSAWKQDPTIQSMLRMLGGTKVTDKKGEDIVDGIEEVFACPQNCEIHTGEKCVVYRKFNEYWCKLTGDNCPIVFYHLPLKDFGLSDDLYIKMNARGKQLTSFENFKADLVNYITEQSESELLDDGEKRKWKKLLDEREGIPIKMDTAWTDIFWKNKSVDSKIDDIYFAFINRFFWDQLFMYKNRDDKYVLDIGKGDETSTQENNNLSYKYLNNSEAGPNIYDTTISYKELDVYKFFVGEIPYSVFEDLQIVLNRYTEIPACKWEKSFRFIPAYENDSNGNNIEITDRSGEKVLKVTYLNQVQRIVFHAICKYFKEGEADKTSLERWMRVVWNLVSGEGVDGRPQIRSTRAVRTAIEFIKTLNSHSVYKSLKEKMLFTDKPSDFECRCNEEIAKAKQIIDEKGELREYKGSHKNENGSVFNYWEDIIKEAEKSAFFKGSIRFLFQNSEGRADWNDFDKKWTIAQDYFDKNGVKKDYLANSILLRTFISKFKDWDEFWDFNYDNEIPTWRDLLISERYRPLHEIFTKKIQSNVDFTNYSSSLEKFDEGFKQIQETVQNDLVKTKIIEKFSSVKNAKLNWRSDKNKYCLYPKNTKTQKNICVIADIRNTILSELLRKSTAEFPSGCNQKIEGCDFFWGWDIIFKYNKSDFQWNIDGNVYLIDNNEPKKKDDGSYYSFPVKGINDVTAFEGKLKELIELISVGKEQ